MSALMGRKVVGGGFSASFPEVCLSSSVLRCAIGWSPARGSINGMFPPCCSCFLWVEQKSLVGLGDSQTALVSEGKVWAVCSCWAHKLLITPGGLGDHGKCNPSYWEEAPNPVHFLLGNLKSTPYWLSLVITNLFYLVSNNIAMIMSPCCVRVQEILRVYT